MRARVAAVQMTVTFDTAPVKRYTLRVLRAWDGLHVRDVMVIRSRPTVVADARS
jgi:hypothetical protein